MRRKYYQHLGNLTHIKTLNDLDPSHLHELREFHSLGRSIAAKILLCNHNRFTTSNNPPITMKIGYHTIPSLEPLHLHIISSDLDSPCITKRVHVVSFTSPLFFVEAVAVERHLESAFTNSIVLTIRKDRAKSVRDNSPMICAKCNRVSISLPDWKRHIDQCSAVAPKEESLGRLNSLLGWRRGGIISIQESDGAGQMKESQMGLQ